MNGVGNVRGLEKWECVSWKVFIMVSRIGGGRTWWLCMGDMVFGCFLGTGLTYMLANR